MIWRILRWFLVGLGILLAAFAALAAWVVHHAELGRECVKLHPVLATHTVPPFPRLSIVMGEDGTTILRVTIGPDGTVRAADVHKSSGSVRLDDAAAEHVKSHWKWQPPHDRNCKPATASTLIAIAWHLRDAAPPSAPHGH